jgi:predicted Rossmann fold nucleotide-binding protein DprA/Smf involved in DNA uptake
MNIAIVGSREYPYLDDVKRLVQMIAEDDKVEPGFAIISGGARGVDETAEQEANRLGLQVISFRVCQIELDGYGVEEWHFGRETYIRVMRERPVWADYESALLYRNSVIVEHADRVVAFRAAFSRGTSLAMDFAHANKRPLREYGVSEFERLQVA